MAMPCPDAVTLERFLLGRLPPAESERVEEHFGVCAACCTHVEAHTVADAFSEALRRAGNQARAADPLQQELIERVRRLIPSIAAAHDAASLSPTAAVHPRTPSGMDNPDQPTEPAAPAEGSLDFLAPPQAPGEIGRLGPYRVLRVLGRGGMGLVFEVEDPELQRRVALKVIAPQLSAHGDFRKRFLREARAAAALSHDHVVPIYHVGEDRGLPYITMPLLQGESLEQKLRRERQLPVAEAARIGRETALGLAAAHERGLVHRDVKPANIWLEEGTRRVKLLDFGLARAASGDMEGLTAAGSIAGTPGYAAPEQADDQPVDGRADLFGLGIVLYRMLTGCVPYPATSMLNFLKALARDVPATTRNINPQVPCALSALVTKLTAKDPARRPESATAVAAALAEFEAAAGKSAASAGRPPTRRAGLVATGAALLLAALLTAGMVIVVRDKKGKEIARIPLPENGSASVEPDGSPAQDPPHVLETERKSPARPNSPLDRLDPANIPAAERFAWQPKELVAVFGEHRRRHSSQVMQVAYSGDGRWIASIAADGLRLVDAVTLQEKLTPGVEDGGVSVAFTPDGKTLVAAMSKGVFLWDVAGPEPLERATLPVIGSGLAISGDGRILAIVESNGTLTRWDLTIKTPRLHGQRKRIGENSTSLLVIALSPDGKVLLSGCTQDNKPRLWDLSQAEPIEKVVLNGHESRIDAVAYSPDGRFFATVSFGMVRLWDASRSPPVQLAQDTRQYHQRTLSFSKDGCIVLIGGLQGCGFYRWDGKTLLREQSIPGYIVAAALSPDEKTLVTGDMPGAVRVWDRKGIEFAERQPLGPACWGKVAFSPGGEYLAGANDPDKVCVWAIGGPRAAWTQKCIGNPQDLAFSPDGRRLAVWGENGASLFAIGPQGIQQKGPVDCRTQWPFRGQSADGKVMATLGKDGNVILWDVTSTAARKIRQITLGPPPQMTSYFARSATAFAFSSDLQFAANACFNDTLRLWDLASGRERAALKHPAELLSVAFARDGRTLAAGDALGQVKLWDLTETQPKEKFELAGAQSRLVQQVEFSPDGRFLATVIHEARVAVWDLTTKKQIYEWKLPINGTETIRWAEDSRHLATVNGNGTIYILRPAPGAGPSK